MERLGAVLRGKWRLDALLGIGGTATVYSATHRNGVRGAVKILHRAFSSDTTMRARFLNEGKVANRVEHPGVVRVLDDDVTEDGEVFLVMELLLGHTLAQRADSFGGRLPVEEAVLYVIELLDILATAHAHGVLHRDIKPENVFVSTDQRVHVLDFGLACSLDPDEDVRLTKSGITMGTPSFMAPEQARGRRDLIDARTDVYSVGATLFNLLSGEQVHGSDYRTVAELVAITVTRQARSLRDVMPEAPESLVAIVDRALRLDKEERWASATEMRAALASAYQSLGQKAISFAPSGSHTTTSVPGESLWMNLSRLATRRTSPAPTPGPESSVALSTGRRRFATWCVAALCGAPLVVASLSTIPKRRTPTDAIKPHVVAIDRGIDSGRAIDDARAGALATLAENASLDAPPPDVAPPPARREHALPVSHATTPPPRRDQHASAAPTFEASDFRSSIYDRRY